MTLLDLPGFCHCPATSIYGSSGSSERGLQNKGLGAIWPKSCGGAKWPSLAVFRLVFVMGASTTREPEAEWLPAYAMWHYVMSQRAMFACRCALHLSCS